MKKRSYLFAALAILLSNAMCATVAYRWRDMICGIEHGGYSAPASVALLSALPFAVGIAVCVILSVYLHRRAKHLSHGSKRA